MRTAARPKNGVRKPLTGPPLPAPTSTTTASRTWSSRTMPNVRRSCATTRRLPTTGSGSIWWGTARRGPRASFRRSALSVAIRDIGFAKKERASKRGVKRLSQDGESGVHVGNSLETPPFSLPSPLLPCPAHRNTTTVTILRILPETVGGEGRACRTRHASAGGERDGPPPALDSSASRAPDDKPSKRTRTGLPILAV